MCVYSAKEWGLTPELRDRAWHVASAALGAVVGALAMRRQGIYFAMITLAVAQMVYFFYLQTPLTDGEDGIQRSARQAAGIDLGTRTRCITVSRFWRHFC